MAQNQPLLVAPPMASTTDDELLQAEAMLWCHALGYMKTMALQCAITLGIPNAIHRRGGEASLPELHAAVPVTTTKRPCLSRLMRFLSASDIFAETTTAPADAAAAGPRYRLTAASRLLVDDDADAGSGIGSTCLTQMMLLMSSPLGVAASQSLAGWLIEEGGATAAAETPFAAAHGKALYEFLSRDAEFGARFGAAMSADSRVVSGMLVGDGVHGKEVFAGVASLVDAGGGDGTMARAIAGAFPHVRCTVLELPFVVDAAAAAVPAGDGTVEFVAGDMMEFIPPADAVLFKGVLHNWSDEDCVRALKRAREAISTREPKGKVIIIDIVIGSPSKQTLEAQLCLDLCMMVQTTGKEREEETWHRIFRDAGFIRYKIRPGLGPRSLIEVYP